MHRGEGCGSTETWQPFQDRRDVRQLCAEPGRHRLDFFDATRSFFGQTDTRRFKCDEGASAFVAGARPGDVSVLDGSEDGPAGKVSYHEEYTLVLQSLEPRR